MVEKILIFCNSYKYFLIINKKSYIINLKLSKYITLDFLLFN